MQSTHAQGIYCSAKCRECGCLMKVILPLLPIPPFVEIFVSCCTDAACMRLMFPMALSFHYIFCCVQEVKLERIYDLDFRRPSINTPRRMYCHGVERYVNPGHPLLS